MTSGKVRIRVAALVVDAGRLLMVEHHKHGQRYWLLPGGGLEYGETIATCAVREIKEETDLDIEPEDLLFVVESIPPDGHRHVINFYLRARLLGGTLKQGRDDNLAAVRFVPLEEVAKLTVYPPVTAEMLRAIQGEAVRPLLLGNRWEAPRGDRRGADAT